jgi:hypothetical protein
LGYLAIEIAAVASGAFIGAVALLSGPDEHWLEFALKQAASQAPPQEVIVVEVSPTLAKTAGCGRAIAKSLTVAGARAGLVLPPLTHLCEGAFDSAALDSELSPPIEALAPSVFRTGVSGRIVGITGEATGSALLTSLGARPARWLSTHDPASVPVLSLDQLNSGDASPALLSERVVVLALAGETPDQGLDVRQIAGALDAAIANRPLPGVPRWALGALALLLGLGIALIHRLATSERQRRFGLALVGGTFVGAAVAETLGLGLLLPLPSLLAGVALTHTILVLPRRAAEARAERDAQRVLQDAGRLLSVQSPRAHDEGEFWRRLARTAAQTHAADDVLIAELPPFSWRLRIWANGETDDSVIKERRRDIRRTPYANLQGVPVASVVNDYLVMKGTPAVLVPLIATTEVEGYLIMIGKAAADEFVDNPRLSEGLARELAQIVRESRIARMRNAAQQQEGGMGDITLSDPGVLERAKAAIAELRLLSALVQNAPVGLFYADSFGDVRILSRPVARWLPDFGIELPAMNTEGSLDAGELTPQHLLGGFARKAGVTPPAITEIGEDGYTLQAPVPVNLGRLIKSLQVRVVPLTRGSGEETTGFVGSVTESAIFSASLAPRPSIMNQTVSSLQVFSLSKVVTSTIATVAHRTDGKVKLQTPRDEAHVVAHRADLEQALEGFLVDAAQHAGKSAGPVVAIAQKRLRVDLKIMDLRLDAPTPALERTLLAPSSPPPGLDSLAELVRAVENSHGEVRIRSEQTWGTVITASLVRARPRVAEVAEVTHLRLHNKPVRIS